MMKSSAMKLVSSVVWVITALGCIHIGLVALGYDLLARFDMAATLDKPLAYTFGVAGVISLIMFAMALSHHNCDCKCQ